MGAAAVIGSVVFLSHLGGVEVTKSISTRALNFLSHLGGVEVKNGSSEFYDIFLSHLGGVEALLIAN